MAVKEITARLADISQKDDWRFLRSLLEEELEKQTEILNLEGEAQLEGAKQLKRFIKKFINRVDGAQNTLDING